MRASQRARKVLERVHVSVLGRQSCVFGAVIEEDFHVDVWLGLRSRVC